MHKTPVSPVFLVGAVWAVHQKWRLLHPVRASQTILLREATHSNNNTDWEGSRRGFILRSAREHRPFRTPPSEKICSACAPFSIHISSSPSHSMHFLSFIARLQIASAVTFCSRGLHTTGSIIMCPGLRSACVIACKPFMIAFFEMGMVKKQRTEQGANHRSLATQGKVGSSTLNARTASGSLDTRPDAWYYRRDRPQGSHRPRAQRPG